MRTLRLNENSWISDRKLQIVEGQTQRSHAVENSAGQVSMTKTGSIPQAPSQREGEQQGCNGDLKQLCQSHRKAACLHSSPGAKLGSQLQ